MMGHTGQDHDRPLKATQRLSRTKKTATKPQGDNDTLATQTEKCKLRLSTG